MPRPLSVAFLAPPFSYAHDLIRFDLWVPLLVKVEFSLENFLSVTWATPLQRKAIHPEDQHMYVLWHELLGL